MSEMVERVAKAIAKVHGDPSLTWEEYVDEARAAIEAMREPTEAMVNAADETGKGGGVGDEGGIEPVIYDLDEVWEAMIDAALSTPDPK